MFKNAKEQQLFGMVTLHFRRQHNLRRQDELPPELRTERNRKYRELLAIHRNKVAAKEAAKLEGKSNATRQPLDN